MLPFSPRELLLKAVPMPEAKIPVGRLVELPGRGSTFVTDTPGPTPDAPVVVLLHAVACTGLLTWYPSIEPLSARYRVITLDQRWHGRGIHSRTFSLYDCADDVAALLDVLEIDQAIMGGFSMGSMVAQRVWRQHPKRVRGLVLAASTDHFRRNFAEQVTHQSIEALMLVSRGIAHSRTATKMTRAAAKSLHLDEPSIQSWALGQVMSTSPWAVAQAVAALGRHHSRPWMAKIDVPTAVVIPQHDKVIPPERQRKLARRIPGATIHELDAGHASCVMEADVFVPAFLAAVDEVNARALAAALRPKTRARAAKQASV